MTFEDIDNDLKRIAERAFKCPRCPDGKIPTNEHPGEYPGALSRADNMTYICSACGFDEGMVQYRTGHVQSVDEWPVEIQYRMPEVPQEVLDKLRNVDPNPFQ